jgi:hypothetical protein
LPNIDKAFDATLAKREHGMWRAQLELAEQGDSRNSWKFTNERSNPTGTLASTTDRDEDSLHLPRFQVSDHIIDGLSVQGTIVPLTGGIDPKSLLWSQQRGNRR